MLFVAFIIIVEHFLILSPDHPVPGSQIILVVYSDEDNIIVYICKHIQCCVGFLIAFVFFRFIITFMDKACFFFDIIFVLTL